MTDSPRNVLIAFHIYFVLTAILNDVSVREELVCRLGHDVLADLKLFIPPDITHTRHQVHASIEYHLDLL